MSQQNKDCQEPQPLTRYWLHEVTVNGDIAYKGYEWSEAYRVAIEGMMQSGISHINHSMALDLERLTAPTTSEIEAIRILNEPKDNGGKNGKEEKGFSRETRAYT